MAGLLFILATGPARAQLVREINPLDPTTNGLHLYSLSAFGSYYSSVVPSYGGYGVDSTIMQAFGSDASLGGAASLGWSRNRRASNFAVNYTASYSGNVHYTEWNRLNHQFSFTAGRPIRLRRRLTFYTSGDASVTTLDQFLFTPGSVGSVVANPSTYDDLVTGAMHGGFSTSQLASALTGSSVLDAPTRGLLFGNRVLSIGLQAALSYSATRRLAIRVGISGSRFQPLRLNRNSRDVNAPSGTDFSGQQTNAQQDPVLWGVTSASADVSISYSLNQRTAVGGGVAESRGFSGIQDTYNTTASGFFARKMTENWFVQANVGAGIITPVRNIYKLPTSPRPSFGAATGYQLRGHTIMASHQRTAGDPFAAGASWAMMSSAAWSWAAHSSWSIYSSFTHQTMQNRGIGDITGWTATIGAGRSIGRGFMLDTQYAHMAFSGSFGAIYQFAVDGVRASLVWSPGGVTRKRKSPAEETGQEKAR